MSDYSQPSLFPVKPKRTKRTTPDQKRQMVEAYLGGATLDEAAALYGLTSKACRNALKAAGMITRWRPATPEQKAGIIALYQQGKSARVAGAAFGFTESPALLFLRKAGVERRQGGPPRKHLLNEDFFARIRTEEQAYVLGFITADGGIVRTTLTINLARKDRGHLLKILAAMSASYPIFDAHYKNNTPQSSIFLTSRKLITDLAKIGVGPRKSATIEAWQGPRALMRHYWRGVFDGDGCIARHRRWWQIVLAGSPALTQAFQGFVQERTGDTPGKVHVHRRGPACWASYAATPKVVAITGLLYDGATIFLERKQALAETLWADTASLCARYKRAKEYKATDNSNRRSRRRSTGR